MRAGHGAGPAVLVTVRGLGLDLRIRLKLLVKRLRAASELSVLCSIYPVPFSNCGGVVQMKCAVCSAPFDAKRKTAKYCSRRCSMRASRGSKPAQPPARPGPMPVDPDAELWTATLAELTAADRVASSHGQAALILARRIDGAHSEPGGGLAALVKQHGLSLADALKGGAAEVNPLDELRSRRDRKRSAG